MSSVHRHVFVNLVNEHRWTHGAWQAFAWFNGIVGVVSMTGAVLLTLYSLWLYMQRYGGLLRTRSA